MMLAGRPETPYSGEPSPAMFTPVIVRGCDPLLEMVAKLLEVATGAPPIFVPPRLLLGTTTLMLALGETPRPLSGISMGSPPSVSLVISRVSVELQTLWG